MTIFFYCESLVAFKPFKMSAAVCKLVLDEIQAPRENNVIMEPGFSEPTGNNAPVWPRYEEKKESLESEINIYLNIAPLSWYCSSSLNNIISVFSSFSSLFFLL